jgi:hypothetical protein
MHLPVLNIWVISKFILFLLKVLLKRKIALKQGLKMKRKIALKQGHKTW